MPRRCGLALLPLLLMLGTGCVLPERGERTSWLNRMGSPDDGRCAVLEVALIERPAGDTYLNRGVWEHADELVLDLDRRATLDENGLRVGLLVGAPPEEFQELLLSKRSCSNPHALLIPPGRAVPIYLGGVREQTTFDLVQGPQRHAVALDQARYGLEVLPSAAEGKTRLTFTPKVENGEPALPFVRTPGSEGWQLRIERPNKRYAELSWEVALGPGQYLIIGARADRPGTLGHRALFPTEEGRPHVQRLLVLRGGRAPAAAASGGAGSATYLTGPCPPLAVRATMPVARGKGL